MGRNVIPKLGEWRDGRKYQFTTSGKDDSCPKPNDGRMIVYERLTINGRDVLATCYADGFQECMASMWQSGYNKGEKAGYERAKREIRKALEI